jgi:hypothetical protein
VASSTIFCSSTPLGFYCQFRNRRHLLSTRPTRPAVLDSFVKRGILQLRSPQRTNIFMRGMCAKRFPCWQQSSSIRPLMEGSLQNPIECSTSQLYTPLIRNCTDIDSISFFNQKKCIIRLMTTQNWALLLPSPIYVDEMDLLACLLCMHG